FGAGDCAAPTPVRRPRPAATVLSGLPASTRPPWGASPTSSTPRLPHLVDTFGRPVMTTPRYPIQPCVRATARARADRPGAATVTRPASTSGERIKAGTKFKTLSKPAAVIGGATTLALAASTTAMAASWMRADLTAIAGAPAAAGNPDGYTTNLTGQG